MASCYHLADNIITENISNQETHSTSEKEPLLTPPPQSNGVSAEEAPEIKAWDTFTETIQEAQDDTALSSLVENSVKVFKLFVIIVCFFIVLLTSVASKGSLLLMTSIIRRNASFKICKSRLGLEKDKTYEVLLTNEERYGWIWCLLFALIIPELMTFFQSCRICIFKSFQRPTLRSIFLVFTTETIHTVGVVMLVFFVFPKLDAVRAFMLTNAVCFVPGILNLISRIKNSREKKVHIVIDIVSLCLQATSFFAWPILEQLTQQTSDTIDKDVSRRWLLTWLIFPALLFVSFGWWENFLPKDTLEQAKEELSKGRHFVFIFISVWKIMLILSFSILFLFLLNGENIKELFSHFESGFTKQVVSVFWLPEKYEDIPGRLRPQPVTIPLELDSNPLAPLTVGAIHVAASLLCYQFGKFACKIGIQGFSYALPLSLTVPVGLSLLLTACGIRDQDVCAYGTASEYLFWQCPKENWLHYSDMKQSSWMWVWILWIISQVWIASHIWTPTAERMASTQRLYINPMYTSAMIDQSLVLNRRKDEEEGVDYYRPLNSNLYGINIDGYTAEDGMYIPQNVPRIYACATMWHETGDEMIQLLKSIFRMDEDQAARKNAQKYFQVSDPDYYLLEAHIFFDDAFVVSDENDDEMVVNSFVKDLVSVMNEAASKVHETAVILPPPVKIPTPYGGRLVWTLPGKNFLNVHLKDKQRIRHKKRWSQVMYMYYFLGHNLMDLVDLSVDEREIRAENTFILALDGDINFRPHAVQLLVDLMKKNKVLGAVCGRIHPVGTGPMVYYQKFEYAIGHWLQKATEHMIGCVLCSPGCFSLFRAKALMNDNVMRTYTAIPKEAAHYIQYDQGEDRWLCTLLLKRGYRVEYSAASDAYTHCPETFAEFYTQRRRWAPSTMANIMDLLIDYKQTVACNDNISMPYIAYQVLMMAGTILGPGTIFLMLVGAMVSVFELPGVTALLINLVPITFFIIICFTTENNTQILVAQIFSAAYALLMMAVLVGIALQVKEDGISSPSAIFLVCLASSFVIAALLHPQEFWCVVHGVLYFMSVPSMYLFLFLYSIVNLNVVSWGTREVPTKMTKKQMEVEQRTIKAPKKTHGMVNWINGLTGFTGSSENDEEGSISFGLGNLFRCMCCTYPKSSDEKMAILTLIRKIEDISTQMDVVVQRTEGASTRPLGVRKTSRIWRHAVRNNLVGTVQEEDEEIDDLDYDLYERQGISLQDDEENHTYNQPESNEYWLSDPSLKDGKVEDLNDEEKTFWDEMIKKYLLPLDDNQEEKAKVATQLKELRNKVVFALLMLNSIFILIVFLLQMQKERLFITWPLNVQANITYIPDTNQVLIDAHPQRLEPINLVLAFFFTLILVIQFVAMLFHRAETISHILASTDLNFCNKNLEDVNPDALVDKNAVSIARDMQRLKNDEKDQSRKGKDQVDRRKTVHDLQKNIGKRPSFTDLSTAFDRRYSVVVENQLDMPDDPLTKSVQRVSKNPNILSVLQRRRSTFVSRQSLHGSQLSSRLPTPNLSRRSSIEMNRLDIETGTPCSSVRSGYSNAAFDDTSECSQSSSKAPRFARKPLGSTGSPMPIVKWHAQEKDESMAELQERLRTISEK